MTHSNNDQTQWQFIYKLGGMASIGAVLVGILEIVITFLPGGNTVQETVSDWFMLFQQNWFMGLRDLGLLNIMLDAFALLIFFALYFAHRESPYQPHAALAAIVSFLGVGVFLATNRAFPMLALSQQYAAATTDAQRAAIEAAGQSMLSVGQSHTPGTFLGFFLVEAAGVLISCVMLRAKIFSKANAYTGIIGFALLSVFEILSSFVAGLSAVMMGFAMIGGILSMAWYILVARRLFQLGRA
ncbi:hypothetical protein ANAEL_02446 [Anaerolineales bacterium]|nr:hypothetical protein ANAEL_02446 [Anaerolineales bacterium]